MAPPPPPPAIARSETQALVAGRDATTPPVGPELASAELRSPVPATKPIRRPDAHTLGALRRRGWSANGNIHSRRAATPERRACKRSKLREPRRTTAAG